MSEPSKLRWAWVAGSQDELGQHHFAHIWLVDDRSLPVRDRMKDQHIEMLRVHPGLRNLVRVFGRRIESFGDVDGVVGRMMRDPLTSSVAIEQWAGEFAISPWTLAHFLGSSDAAAGDLQAVEIPPWTERVLVLRAHAGWRLQIPSPVSPVTRDVVKEWLKVDPRWPLPEPTASDQLVPKQYARLGRASYPANRLLADLPYYEEWARGHETVAEIWESTDGSASLQAFVNRLRRAHEHLLAAARLGLPSNMPAAKTRAEYKRFQMDPNQLAQALRDWGISG